MARVVPSKIVALIRSRANFSCEYCKIPDQVSGLAFEVDHVVARVHGGKSDIDNLAWACAACNLFKGPNLTSIDHSTGEIVRLFNPRCDRWLDHFRLKTGHVLPLTANARVTIVLLRMNSRDAIITRGLCYHDGDDFS